MKKKWIWSHCDLDLWPKVTNCNKVWACELSNRLVKTAFQSVHPFGWNFVHKQSQTHRRTHTQTHCSKNITPPRFRGGVKNDSNLHPQDLKSNSLTNQQREQWKEVWPFCHFNGGSSATVSFKSSLFQTSRINLVVLLLFSY